MPPESAAMTADRQTFAKRERLRASADITLVLKTGRRASRDGLSLTVTGNTGRPARAGFIVRRRIGGAVARNLMKRRMRESYRRLKAQVGPGADLVFSANAVIGYAAVGRAMAQLLEQSLAKDGGK
ncbi:MAG TPA: ribonuclease P protein component [Candidatus Edwardsbacteria bacterium]|nr:ribonuclease P protein component [Candidatus Edwardsbacteria bacterium]